MEDRVQQHAVTVQMVLVPTQEVDAASEATLQVKVSCPEKCDLQGGQVRISDEGGDVVKTVVLTSFDGEANATDQCAVTMPVEPGPHTWTALFLPGEPGDSDQARHEQSSVAFGFSVKAHRISISVWGVSSPVAKGERFTARIGAKCSAGCSLAGLPFAIEDGNGRVATGTLGEAVLPGTAGTYWAEQELVAPPEEGLCQWSASVVPSGLELAHEVSAKPFAFYVAQPADNTVTVRVVDAGGKKPLQHAAIFMDRHRASTDAQGVARVQVSKGSHTLYVSLEHYEPFQMTVQVAGDVTVEAGLQFCPDQYTIADSTISL